MSPNQTPLLTLDDWLAWQLRVHPREIELGLERVREVWMRLGSPRPGRTVITVGGTNGKGSTVAFLEAMLADAGLRVGAFTSPHLLRYNERVRIAGVDADDAPLIAAFARIESVRREIALTYFEFGTLAAILLFSEQDLDVALLEVGLGGRLDAVNLIDADAMIVTTVDLDHQDWLGNDRESIAREKAGIFRADRPAIIGEAQPPASLSSEARRIGARMVAAGMDYRYARRETDWTWQSGSERLVLPLPTLAASCQFANAAAAIAALHALRDRIGWTPASIAHGVVDARVRARLQRFSGPPELVVDVAHNPQAAAVLAEWLGANPPSGRTIAVFGALADKDVQRIVAPLLGLVSAWRLASLAGVSPRGLDREELMRRVSAAGDPAVAGIHDSVESALDAALATAQPGDRVLAFGSFLVASTALSVAMRLPAFATQES